MTKRDWLSKPPLSDLASKADANDAKKVSTTSLNVPNVIKWQYMDGSECVQEFAQDSREKLLYDASELVANCAPSGGDCDPMYRAIVELLDRQAAITECECADCARGMGVYADTLCDPLKLSITELQAEVDGLAAERDQWRALCGRMMDAAHEITVLGEGFE